MTDLEPGEEIQIEYIRKYLVSKNLPDTYKESYFIRRVMVRLRKTNSKNVTEYFSYLKNNISEVELLRKDLSINVTKFFRDKESFEYFCDNLTELMKDQFKKNKNKTIKIWSAGCAIGAEPYSIAIHVDKTINKFNLRGLRVNISATDFNNELLSYARNGIYEDVVLENVSRIDMREYFEPYDKIKNELNVEIAKYKISNKIRNYVDFSHLDLSSNKYPFKNLDILTCRNVLIYFTQEAQFTILKKYYNSLKTNGILFLGRSETMHLSYRGDFKNISPKHRVYEKIDPNEIMPEAQLIKCTECNFTFSRDMDFKVHMKTHYNRKKKIASAREMKFKGTLLTCNYCDKTFITEVRQAAHYKFFHIEEQKKTGKISR